jgi:Animal haem peroxidase
MAHGSKPLRGLESTGQSSIHTGRFGRMFRWLEPAMAPNGAAEENEVVGLLQELAGLMVTTEFRENLEKGESTPDAPITKAEPTDENPTIPAGYTYLGQFIDHDITFDPASSLQQFNDPDALEDFRTPRLDLDCVYGRGPADQPYLYQKPGRTKFILGQDKGVHEMNRPDLQRTADGTALIGDKRNDENKIVAQVQALFLKFHNKVFDELASRFTPGKEDERFLEAQRIVRWCYQWIVLNDFLPKVCDRNIVKNVMPEEGRRGPNLQFYVPHDGNAYIPIEFAVAAYRFGHSMVRPSYALNDTAKSSGFFNFNEKQVPFGRIPIFVAHAHASTDALNGFGELSPELPTFWGIDWSFFFGALGRAKPGAPQIPQPSYRIDSSLVDPLGDLPEFAAAGVPSPFTSLAFRNLLRGFRMRLPSGQRVAQMMGVKTLSEEELWSVKNEQEKLEDWPEGTVFLRKNKKWLEGSAPLWYYILKEAEVRHHGHHLGEVGSRIVAETLIGLAWYDHYSYLFQMPLWTPAAEKLGLTDSLDMLALTTYIG